MRLARMRILDTMTMHELHTYTIPDRLSVCNLGQSVKGHDELSRLALIANSVVLILKNSPCQFHFPPP